MHKRVAAPRDHDSSTGAELLDDEKVHSRLWYHIGIRYILLALTVTVTVLILVAGFPAASALDELESLSAEGSKANLMKQRIAAILQQQRQQRQQRREQQQQWTLEDTKASELVTARQDLSAFQQRLQGRGGGNALSWWGTSEPEPRPTFAELSKSLPSFEELSRDWKPPAAADAFPRVLHQTWRTHMVPPRLAVFMRSWRERSASGWSFRLHTDEDNAALVQSRYSWLHKSYLMMNAIQRADVARLLYMHAFGGVYADLDVELLAPLDALLNQTATLGASAMLGQEPLPHAVLLERQPRQICNAVLASARGHPFWLWALHMAALRVSTDQGWGSDQIRIKWHLKASSRCCRRSNQHLSPVRVGLRSMSGQPPPRADEGSKSASSSGSIWEDVALRRDVGILVGSQMMLNIGVAQVVPVFPLLATEMGLGAAGTGLLISAPAFARLAVNLPLGRLADTVGRKPLMRWGTLITAAGQFGTGLVMTSGLPAVLGMRLLIGAGSASSMSGSSAMMQDLTDRAPQHRAQLMAFQSFVLSGVWAQIASWYLVRVRR